MKFTFKTDRPTGRYSAVFSTFHHIKFKKQKVGNIDDKTYNIRLQVYKKDINEDGNPNCDWKWITLNKKSESLQDAKDFLNEEMDTILENYKLKLED